MDSEPKIKEKDIFSSEEEGTSSNEEEETKNVMSDEEFKTWKEYRKGKKHGPKFKKQISIQEKQHKKAKKDLKFAEKRKKIKQIIAQLKARPYFDQEQDSKDVEQYYSALKGKPNYNNLHTLLASTYSHAKRRENIFPIIDRQPDYTLKCIYTGIQLQNSEGDALMKCDEEHTFPQSYQSGCKKGTGRDMHQIFAASKKANGSRGNKPFGPSDGQIIRDDQRGVVYQGKSKKMKTYVPKLNSGAACRATLYVLTCYDQAADPKKFPPEQLDWIVQQATKQEVTLWQKHRNAELFRLQGNRNPYIDHPKWAETIDFSRAWQVKQHHGI